MCLCFPRCLPAYLECLMLMNSSSSGHHSCSWTGTSAPMTPSRRSTSPDSGQTLSRLEILEKSGDLSTLMTRCISTLILTHRWRGEMNIIIKEWSSGDQLFKLLNCINEFVTDSQPSSENKRIREERQREVWVRYKREASHTSNCHLLRITWMNNSTIIEFSVQHLRGWLEVDQDDQLFLVNRNFPESLFNWSVVITMCVCILIVNIIVLLWAKIKVINNNIYF